ncbi:electron transfer flavoprotein subunit beta/FixA family protein [Carboxydothermus pertinax]|uniref:Electron transfer flavoprotein small subunit n=1 Tax=Carboxydothermus pertinax TaxID=870242 RepID=A0A1L8CV36_9THEO|nr:electron transfer flavoprotein subunit beta/FixA family protein [Carboxydothermus pertinax]GAV22747.1 protein FixA [Carboxydothermus pertinax]
MHAVVLLKQVPDTAEVRIDPKTNTLIREGVPSIINPYDAHALEEALRLKDKYGGKVTVVSMGPPQAAEALKKAISYGADRAILLTDRKFAGSDTLATSYVLAKAIEKIASSEPVDLVFAGKQAIDGDTAQVGPGVAARLNMALITYIERVEEFNPMEGYVVAVRKIEGRKEYVRAKLPALLTALKGINEIRYATMPDMIRAARYQPEIWGKEQLDVEEAFLGLKGSPTQVWKSFVPQAKARAKVEMLTGTPEEVAKVLVEKLVPLTLVANK